MILNKDVISGFVIAILLLLPATMVSSSLYIPKASATGGDTIYVLGGYTGSSESNTVQVYNATTNTWSTTSAAPLPIAVHDAPTVTYNGKIYVMGGYTGAAWTNTVQVYDTSTNTWSTTSVPNMPIASGSAPTVTYSGKIYVIGGYANSGIINTVQVYDPLTNTWSTTSVAPLPVAVANTDASIYNGKIYVIGGLNTSGSIINTVQVYDPLTNTWSTTSVAPLPIAVEAEPVVTYSSNIYVIGGYGAVSGGSINTVQVYDPLTNTWSTTSVAPLPIVSSGTAASIYNSKIYVMGGFSSSLAIPNATVQVYDPLTNTWSTTSVAPLPTAITFESAVVALPYSFTMPKSPTAPVISTVSGITNDNKPTITGTAQAGSTITAYDGTMAIGTTTVSSTGSWSFIVTTALADGTHTITATATNTGGTSPTSSAIVITVDTVPPLTTGSATTQPNIAGWYNSNVIIHFTATDATSGVASVTPDVTISTEGANQQVTGTATDKAGNSASATVNGINIDKTAPMIKATLSPSPNVNGWNNSPVTVTFSCSDTLSGIDKCPTPITISHEGSNQKISGTATDKAGNSASVDVTVNIDLTSPESYNQFDPVTKDILVYGTDNLSGITSNPIAPASIVSTTWNDDDNKNGNEKNNDSDNKNNKGNAELRTYNIVNNAGNMLVLTEKVKKDGNEIIVHVTNIQYGNGPVISVPSNKAIFEWSTGHHTSNIQELEQKITLGTDDNKQEVGAKYSLKDNTSVITTEMPGQEKETKITKSGLVLLHLTTNKGKLLINGE